jgi:hypothetical protein
MALTNAQRQQRHRARRRMAVARNEVVVRLEGAIDDAIETLWAIMRRVPDCTIASMPLGEFRWSCAQLPGHELKDMLLLYRDYASDEEEGRLRRAYLLVHAVLHNDRP